MEKKKSKINRENVTCVCAIVFIIALIGLAYYNPIYISAACMMSALALFYTCYVLKKSGVDKKIMFYVYYGIGILLIGYGLVYAFIKMR